MLRATLICFVAFLTMFSASTANADFHFGCRVSLSSAYMERLPEFRSARNRVFQRLSVSPIDDLFVELRLIPPDGEMECLIDRNYLTVANVENLSQESWSGEVISMTGIDPEIIYNDAVVYVGDTVVFQQ